MDALKTPWIVFESDLLVIKTPNEIWCSENEKVSSSIRVLVLFARKRNVYLFEDQRKNSQRRIICIRHSNIIYFWLYEAICCKNTCLFYFHSERFNFNALCVCMQSVEMWNNNNNCIYTSNQLIIHRKYNIVCTLGRSELQAIEYFMFFTHSECFEGHGSLLIQCEKYNILGIRTPSAQSRSLTTIHRPWGDSIQFKTKHS